MEEMCFINEMGIGLLETRGVTIFFGSKVSLSGLLSEGGSGLQLGDRRGVSGHDLDVHIPIPTPLFTVS